MVIVYPIDKAPICLEASAWKNIKEAFREHICAAREGDKWIYHAVFRDGIYRWKHSYPVNKWHYMEVNNGGTHVKIYDTHDHGYPGSVPHPWYAEDLGDVKWEKIDSLPETLRDFTMSDWFYTNKEIYECFD